MSVFVARGLLIESQDATWLYGTSSEHSTMYQYNFHQARNIYTTMIQTESPYYQPSPSPPVPFGDTLGIFPGDPVYKCGNDFDGCDESWAVILNRTQDIHIGSAGTYSFFRSYSLDFVASNTAQKVLWLITNNYNRVRINNLITIGSRYMAVVDGTGIVTADNQAVQGAPKTVSWAQVSLLDVPSKGAAPAAGDNENADDWNSDWEPCKLTREFKDLDDLANQKDSVRPYCYAYYATTILYKLLGEARAAYSSAESGYDAKFGAYSRYYRQLVESQLRECMAWGGAGSKTPFGPCLKHFSCVFSEMGAVRKIEAKSCPDLKASPSAADSYTMTYTLQDEDGFNKTLSEMYGIDKEWVEYGVVESGHKCLGRQTGDRDEPCINTQHTYRGAPKAKSDFKVPSPKETIEAAGGGMEKLDNTLAATLLDMVLGQWGGSGEHTVQSLALPVFMISQAIESMNTVKDIGQQVEDKERRDLIMTIVSAVVMAIPFAGELGTAIFGATQIARIALLIGTAADVAVSVANAVDDPESAIGMALGMVMGTMGGFSRTPKGFRSIGELRRKFDLRTLASKFGKLFEKNNNSLEKILPVKACKR